MEIIVRTDAKRHTCHLRFDGDVVTDDDLTPSDLLKIAEFLIKSVVYWQEEIAKTPDLNYLHDEFELDL